MKLITKAIKDALPAIYSTDGVPLEKKKVICKFFTPDSNWAWYVFEGKPIEDKKDLFFFGMVHGFEKELGYFQLSQLKSVRGKLGLPLERDLSVFKKTYGELMKRVGESA